MDLLQLKYFCDAAENEKFSQTAKKFFVPVSNISQSIKRLERDLGTELFEHKGNSVRLNYNGREFYKYISKAMELIENAKNCVSDNFENFVGDINLMCESNYKSVTVAIEKFIEKYPNVNFIIHNNTTFDLEFDIFISDDFPPEHSKKILLFDEDIYVCMSKNHRLAKKETVEVGDLENERFIALSASNSLRNIMISTCEKSGFSPNFTIQTYSTAFLRRYIELGLGISFTPESWSKKYSSELTFKKINGCKRKTYAFLPKGKYIKKSILTFLEFLKEAADNNEIHDSTEDA